MAEKWNGVERRSGADRRKGERRRSDAFSIERILDGTASRRSGRDRRNQPRRGEAAPEPPAPEKAKSKP